MKFTPRLTADSLLTPRLWLCANGYNLCVWVSGWICAASQAAPVSHMEWLQTNSHGIPSRTSLACGDYPILGVDCTTDRIVWLCVESSRHPQPNQFQIWRVCHIRVTERTHTFGRIWVKIVHSYIICILYIIHIRVIIIKYVYRRSITVIASVIIIQKVASSTLAVGWIISHHSYELMCVSLKRPYEFICSHSYELSVSHTWHQIFLVSRQLTHRLKSHATLKGNLCESTVNPRHASHAKIFLHSRQDT